MFIAWLIKTNIYSVFPDKTILLAVNEWGHMGVKTITPLVGVIIGPPAERLYAVEPVGVEIIIPSARYVFIYKSLT